MKILQTAIITIAIVVILVVVSVTAFGTFSFAVRTNTIHSQSITTPNATHTKTVPSQITTKDPVAHNATTLTSGTGACSDTDNYLWNHVYGKTDHSTPPNYRFHDYGHCITVTGTVYSSGGTTQEPDGDLHFTLQLDPQYEQYSNRYDPPCIPHPAGSPACKNIIVEVICHNAINPSYIKEFGNYCKGVHSVFQGIPSQGDKLSVSGRWVQDIDETTPKGQRHAPWNEIHPASNIH